MPKTPGKRGAGATSDPPPKRHSEGGSSQSRSTHLVRVFCSGLDPVVFTSNVARSPSDAHATSSRSLPSSLSSSWSDEQSPVFSSENAQLLLQIGTEQAVKLRSVSKPALEYTLADEVPPGDYHLIVGRSAERVEVEWHLSAEDEKDEKEEVQDAREPIARLHVAVTAAINVGIREQLLLTATLTSTRLSQQLQWDQIDLSLQSGLRLFAGQGLPEFVNESAAGPETTVGASLTSVGTVVKCRVPAGHASLSVANAAGTEATAVRQHLFLQLLDVAQPMEGSNSESPQERAFAFGLRVRYSMDVAQQPVERSRTCTVRFPSNLAYNESNMMPQQPTLTARELISPGEVSLGEDAVAWKVLPKSTPAIFGRKLEAAGGAPESRDRSWQKLQRPCVYPFPNLPNHGPELRPDVMHVLVAHPKVQNVVAGLGDTVRVYGAAADMASTVPQLKSLLTQLGCVDVDDSLVWVSYDEEAGPQRVSWEDQARLCIEEGTHKVLGVTSFYATVQTPWQPAQWCYAFTVAHNFDDVGQPVQHVCTRCGVAVVPQRPCTPTLAFRLERVQDIAFSQPMPAEQQGLGQPFWFDTWEELRLLHSEWVQSLARRTSSECVILVHRNQQRHSITARVLSANFNAHACKGGHGSLQQGVCGICQVPRNVRPENIVQYEFHGEQTVRGDSGSLVYVQLPNTGPPRRRWLPIAIHKSAHGLSHTGYGVSILAVITRLKLDVPQEFFSDDDLSLSLE